MILCTPWTARKFCGDVMIDAPNPFSGNESNGNGNGNGKKRKPKKIVRGAGGKFAKGNQSGSGNPVTKQIHDYRAALMAVVSFDRLKRIVEALAKKAEKGEPWAVKEILDRTMGKPVQPLSSDNPDGERLPVRIIFTDQ